MYFLKVLSSNVKVLIARICNTNLERSNWAFDAVSLKKPEVAVFFKSLTLSTPRNIFSRDMLFMSPEEMQTA